MRIRLLEVASNLVSRALLVFIRTCSAGLVCLASLPLTSATWGESSPMICGGWALLMFSSPRWHEGNRRPYAYFSQLHQSFHFGSALRCLTRQVNADILSAPLFDCQFVGWHLSYEVAAQQTATAAMKSPAQIWRWSRTGRTCHFASLSSSHSKGCRWRMVRGRARESLQTAVNQP